MNVLLNNFKQNTTSLSLLVDTTVDMYNITPEGRIHSFVMDRRKRCNSGPKITMLPSHVIKYGECRNF